MAHVLPSSSVLDARRCVRCLTVGRKVWNRGYGTKIAGGGAVLISRKKHDIGRKKADLLTHRGGRLRTERFIHCVELGELTDVDSKSHAAALAAPTSPAREVEVALICFVRSAVAPPLADVDTHVWTRPSRAENVSCGWGGAAFLRLWEWAQVHLLWWLRDGKSWAHRALVHVHVRS